MYQTSLTPVIAVHQPRKSQGFYSNLQINSLIEEKKIIRIVRPTLQSEIESRHANGRFPAYIIQHRGQLFLSLQSIQNSQQREQVFSILRGYQVDDTIDVSQLPDFIRRVLGESTSVQNNFVSSLTLGTFLGGISGILALALTLIGLMIAGVSTMSDTGLRITAWAFALGSVLGCAVCTLVLWMRFQPAAE